MSTGSADLPRVPFHARRNVRFGLAVLGATALGAGVLHLRPPVEGAYLLCPWLALTGTDCPFCGGLRAVSALTEGDLSAAADYNLLVVLGLPLVVALAAAAVLLGTRAAPVLRAVFAPRAVWSVFGIVMAWFVLRLLPVAGWLTTAA